MAGSFPTDRNQQVNSGRTTDPAWRHPEYNYWQSEWEQVRDSYLGEVEIKRKASYYLPQLEGMSKNEYYSYLDRAAYYNMVARTVSALVGKLFRRAPISQGIPARLQPALRRISKNNESLNLFIKLTAQEVIQMGRVGVLLDMDAEGRSSPFLASYLAENILDWGVQDIDGRFEVSYVVLREIRIEKSTYGAPRVYWASYRVLRLEWDEDRGDYVYRQYYYTSENSNADIDGTPTYIFTPQNRGVPFNRIPFVFFGPFSNNCGVEKSPVLDIAKLNISHYRSYAHLEHGRFYTGLPIYYCQVADGQERGEYTLGPSVVWEVAPGERPGIIEFNGNGLRFLESALTQKEAQIASLGGRLLGAQGSAASDSDNAVKIKESNEQSLLLNVATVLDDGFSQLLRWWAMWQDVPDAQLEGISVEINKDFLLDGIGAREFRAVQAMYKDNIIPIEVVYDYLKRAQVVPDYLNIDEFKKLLDRDDSFPNQPDVAARMEGYPDAKTKLEHEKEERSIAATNIVNADAINTAGYVEQEDEDEDEDEEEEEEKSAPKSTSPEEK